MIKSYTLFSGSQGNSCYVSCGNTEILIDAGKSCGAIEKSLNALGTSLSRISAIFITHEHTDHIGGLEIISKKFQIPVYITAPSYSAGVRGGSYLERFAKPQDICFEKSIGELSIRSFPVPHDSAQNVGYVISSRDDTFGISTDIGHLTTVIGENLELCSRVIIESNHDIQMVKDGPYPQHLKDRILSSSGHLSNEKCADFAAYLCDKGVRQITLAHLSRENNMPKIAFEETRSHLNDCGFEHIPVKIAMPDIAVCASDDKSYPTFT
jgi:phosphoribosyl 1,2-cyclic phosphodiesterase